MGEDEVWEACLIGARNGVRDGATRWSSQGTQSEFCDEEILGGT